MMDRILDQIYIGNSSDAEKFEEIKRNGITAILNVAHDLNRPWDLNVLSLKVGLTDGPCPLNRIGLRVAVDMLSTLVNEGYEILVHCHNGVNRSPFVVAHYLSVVNKTDWKIEFEKIKAMRPQCFRKPWMEDCQVNR